MTIINLACNRGATNILNSGNVYVVTQQVPCMVMHAANSYSFGAITVSLNDWLWYSYIYIYGSERMSRCGWLFSFMGSGARSQGDICLTQTHTYSYRVRYAPIVNTNWWDPYPHRLSVTAVTTTCSSRVQLELGINGKGSQHKLAKRNMQL